MPVFPRAESSEVFRCLWACVLKQLHLDAPRRRSTNCHIEKHYRVSPGDRLWIAWERVRHTVWRGEREASLFDCKRCTSRETHGQTRETYGKRIATHEANGNGARTRQPPRHLLLHDLLLTADGCIY